ncbi:thioesterase family protein [Pseudomonas sp. CAU 1711]|uniref:acyl-CoA thioesterase n=1 Tax=Pseudomonas sp. CAU 1711 TaxID=3140356 RepID=UPI0032609EE0
MTFAELIHAVHTHPQHVVVPALWGQGRAAFGGLVAAMLYEAMRLKVAPGKPVRSLAVTFVAPLQMGEATAFEVEVLREGKSVSQVLGRAVQNGAVVAMAQGSFGAARESAVRVVAEPAPAMKAVEECQELGYIPGVTPEFTRFLAMRWGEGGMPFSNNQSRSMGGWVRLRSDVSYDRVSEAHLLALVDAWPPVVLAHLSKPAPGSSLTWTIEFVHPIPSLTTHDWCLYRAEIEHAADGYGHIAARLWTADGQLLALSRQTTTVFD